MNDYPNDSWGDVDYWGLTPVQATRYHARLACMHADASVRFAELAVHYARQGQRFSGVAIALGVLSILVLAVGRVIA